MKLFVGRRSYPCLNQKRLDKKIQGNYRTIENYHMMFQSDSIKQTLPRPAGNRACIDFSQDALFGIFGPQKTQIGRLEKIQHKKLAGFFPGPARNRTTARFLKTLYLEFLAPKKLKLDVLRKSNKRNLQDFSQDPPGIEPPHVFSRRSIWNFWPPKNSKWTS